MQCPNGYAASGSVCVAGSIVCPTNFAIAADGITCELSCATGFQANSAGTGCVITCTAPEVASDDGTTCVAPAVSVTLYYFPFLIAGVVALLFSICGWRYFTKSLFLANTIVLWSFLETGALGLQTYLAYE